MSLCGGDWVSSPCLWHLVHLVSSLWLVLGQVLDLWLDVFLISDDFLLRFTELCVPGNEKLCVAVGDSGIFSLSWAMSVVNCTVSEGRYLRAPNLYRTVHASSNNCLLRGQMENENPVCILCPVFSLMGRLRYFSYLNNMKTPARLALGQSSIFVPVGECAFCNCACYQEISKGRTDALEEQQCLIRPGVCHITAAPLGLFCANPIWQRNFVPAHPFALCGGLMWCFIFSPWPGLAKVLGVVTERMGKASHL